PSGPPPPLPEVSMKPSEVAMDMRKRAPKADPTKKPVPKAGPTSPPPPLPSMKQEQPKKAKPPHIVAGPSSPPPPLPQATKEPSKKPVLKAGPSTPTVTPKEESKVAPVVGGPPAPPPLPPLAPPAPPLELPKTPTTPTASPSRANLLEEIRRGVPLSKVGATPEKESPEEETPPRSGNSIMDAISTKLNEMRDKIQPESDSEEEEDDSDDWDEC
uniref:WH2 domain-containing protein n=1 Tax=Steinernema glaseri TaxID=37863 RepID=A0A1I8ATW4_9BILA